MASTYLGSESLNFQGGVDIEIINGQAHIALGVRGTPYVSPTTDGSTPKGNTETAYIRLDENAQVQTFTLLSGTEQTNNLNCRYRDQLSLQVLPILEISLKLNRVLPPMVFVTKLDRLTGGNTIFSTYSSSEFDVLGRTGARNYSLYVDTDHIYFMGQTAGMDYPQTTPKHPGWEDRLISSSQNWPSAVLLTSTQYRIN
ncbi:MAG: hypothetical protein R2795_18560 [Saprospiraceae bacterium]